MFYAEVGYFTFMQKKKIAYLEPFYGGSHKAFADALARHSQHEIDLFTLPDRFWKWRTRGASLAFYKMLPDPSQYDLVMASDLVNLAELMGLWQQPVKTVLYMHEDQLTYPLPEGEERDASYVMTDLISAACATRVVFNSYFHEGAFLESVRAFIGRMPDARPGWVATALEEKSRVLYPGIEFADDVLNDGADDDVNAVDNGPTILWPHRWEWDKRPEDFYRVLAHLQMKGVPYSLVLLGDRVDNHWLRRIETDLCAAIRFSGFASKETYNYWLQKCDIVVSLAVQENFGIAAVEAMAAGCMPLFPNSLSYPEIVPRALHGRCLYDNLSDLEHRIASHSPLTEHETSVLKSWVNQFSWKTQATHFDVFFDREI